MTEHSQVCPDCAETIKANARICRYCGYRFSDKAKPHPQTEVEPQEQRPGWLNRTFGADDPPAATSDPMPSIVTDNVRDAHAFGQDPSEPISTSTDLKTGLGIIGLIGLTIFVAFILNREFGNKDFSRPVESENSYLPSSADSANAIFNSTDAEAEAVMQAADAAIARADAIDAEARGGSSIPASDLVRVCKAAVASLFGHSPSVMTVDSNSGGIVRIRYNRPDDGTVWKNECRTEGNRVIWRSVDAGSSVSGPWRIRPADEVLTYKLNGKSVDITTDYGGGETAAETYTIS